MKHMGAASPECREWMRNYENERNRKIREQREQRIRELNARVPEQLGRTYQAVKMPEGKVMSRRDRVSHLAADLGLSMLEIRAAIDTGQTQHFASRFCQGGTYWYRVVPVDG